MLNKLRNLMKTGSPPLEAYVVPQCDPHGSEYLAESYKRIQALSGFTGSSGTVIVTGDKALLWTDGRYFLQANSELDLSRWVLMKAHVPPTPSEGAWLSQNLPSGSIVGVDPVCMPSSNWRLIKNETDKNNITLIPVAKNLVDEIWTEKPPLCFNPIKPLPIDFSGKTVHHKLQEVRKIMSEKGADAYVVTALDDIAWLLNLRGSDIPFNPVFFSYAVLCQNSLHVFMGEECTQEITEHFDREQANVNIHKYEEFYDFITNILKNDANIKKILVPKTANYKLCSMVPEKQRLTDFSIVSGLKVIKNDTEVRNMIHSHVKDGLALCRYFAWLEEEVPEGRVTEISGASVLQKFREELDDFVGLSFPTISSSGPNAAIVHYKPSAETDRVISVNEMYLCDSGAQFLGGTTDVTRTLHFGEPTLKEKEFYTMVFKGQAALGMAVFPNKTVGSSLDSIARLALWKAGLDYAHGTGHGIGSFLNVHEGPICVASRVSPGDPGLQEGMFLSNEPGVYVEGEFGIRLENIVRVVQAVTPNSENFLCFEPVTLCPLQTKILIPSMLTPEEIDYLNSYHRRCYEVLAPLLQERGYVSALQWLEKETQPI